MHRNRCNFTLPCTPGMFVRTLLTIFNKLKNISKKLLQQTCPNIFMYIFYFETVIDTVHNSLFPALSL